MSDHATFLALRTATFDLGLEAAFVKAVVPRRGWTGSEPFDLDQLVAQAAHAPDTQVLVIDDRQGPRAVQTTFPLVLRTVARNELYGLPPVLRRGGPSASFSRIAQEAHAPVLLVLDHGALFKKAEPTSLGGEDS